MKIAVVHDWLVTFGGAERVLEQILKLYPEADIFTLYDFLPDEDRDFLKNKKITTSFLQKFPFAKKKYRSYLPLMPLAIEQFDLSEYDLIISNSYAVAKGVITGPDQLHIAYVQSPIRYAWDLMYQYLKEADLTKGPSSWLARMILHYIRMWDVRTANGVDFFLGNSRFIVRRIKKVYRRKATVMYPPVDVSTYGLHLVKNGFYLTASRMVPYKKISLIVEAFAHMPDKKLVVIGDGPGYKKIKNMATSNVEVLGYQPTSIMRRYMQRAKAFVFAAQEDFGIVPIEAQACGTPVIAFGKGGILDTVIENETGIFFHKQDTTSIINAIKRFERLSEKDSFNPVRIRQNAERFSNEHFLKKFKSFVDSALAEHDKNINGLPEEPVSARNRMKTITESIEKEYSRKLILK